jgi:hypothetical protein
MPPTGKKSSTYPYPSGRIPVSKLLSLPPIAVTRFFPAATVELGPPPTAVAHVRLWVGAPATMTIRGVDGARERRLGLLLCKKGAVVERICAVAGWRLLLGEVAWLPTPSDLASAVQPARGFRSN